MSEEKPRTAGYILSVLSGKTYAVEDTATIEGAWQLHIAGHDPASAYLMFEGGRLSVTAGVHPAPEGEISLDAESFVRLCYNEVTPKTLVREGLLKAKGDARLYELLVVISEFDGTAAQLRKIDETFTHLAGIVAIERVSDPTVEQLKQAGVSKTPLVITGALESWRARHWSLASLTEQYGEILVRGAEMPTAMPFGKFLAGFSDATARMKTGSTSMPEELVADLGPLPYFPERYESRYAKSGGPFIETFFSAKGGVTHLHRDVPDGAVAIFLGKRRFILYSPDQAPLMYPYPGTRGDYQACRANPSHPDYAKHPRFRDARPVHLVLEPGELLYLPGGWFHHVVAEEHSIAAKFHLSERWFA